MKPVKKQNALILFIVAVPWLIVLSAFAMMDVVLTDTFRIGFISISAAAGAIQAWAILKIVKAPPTQQDNALDRDAQGRIFQLGDAI